MGILASGPTLLRQLRRRVIFSSVHAPRVLGIDDWAWRKGRRYGTILCDLERGQIVDLLPDRSVESTAQWLRAHPGTEIFSRDRASLYAQAATEAVPHAIQVAEPSDAAAVRKHAAADSGFAAAGRIGAAARRNQFERRRGVEGGVSEKSLRNQANHGFLAWAEDLRGRSGLCRSNECEKGG